MPTTFDEISYWLEQIATPEPWRDYVLPVLGIAATVFLGWGALKAARAANRIAKQNTELALREERRRFGDAVISYYESRHEDVRSGRNWNMPHWTEAAQAVATEVGEPNSEALLKWVTETIDHATQSDSVPDRPLNAIHIRATVPIVVAKWVNNPVEFNEPPFKLWHERVVPPAAGEVV